MIDNRTPRSKRHLTIRRRVSGTAYRPRLSVYRGLRHIYIQLIDDESGRTLIGLSDLTLSPKGTGKERAKALAKELYERATKEGITTAVFDRGGFHYHGQVKIMADQLRELGMKL